MSSIQRKRILIAIICMSSCIVDQASNTTPQDDFSSLELSQQVTALVQDGSPESVERLYELSKSGDRSSFDKASQGIVQIAKRLLLAGELDEAKRHAKNIWLSSSPHNVRVDAWNILFLTKSAPRLLPNGHTVLIKAPGGRDHDRFDQWLRKQFVDPNPWINDFQIHYEPTLIEKNRAGETAWITFVVDNARRESELIRLLQNSKSTFPTNRWTVVREKSLVDALK